ncbi:uncharacterized protein LOC127705037 [Mytilus californianus]|uniref:uncharacterized protein LOC127705037 n=1 Tax=Mytilus californianus TaxID=6549 RepID=UPI0022479A02|nr:uncharacterized protein LOC127705037 [Mytilus californianus]
MDTTKIVDTTLLMCTGNELIRSEFDDHYFRTIHFNGPVRATVSLEHEQTIVKKYKLPVRLRGQIFFEKPLCIGYSFPVYVFQYRLEVEWTSTDVMLMIFNSANETFHFVDCHVCTFDWWRHINPLKEPLKCLISPDLDMFLFRCPMEASPRYCYVWYSISEQSMTEERTYDSMIPDRDGVNLVFHPSYPCSVIALIHGNSNRSVVCLKHLYFKNMKRGYNVTNNKVKWYKQSDIKFPDIQCKSYNGNNSCKLIASRSKDVLAYCFITGDKNTNSIVNLIICSCKDMSPLLKDEKCFNQNVETIVPIFSLCDSELQIWNPNFSTKYASFQVPRLNLMVICRAAILRTCSPSSIVDLPLPTTLQDYLKFT